MTHRRSGPKGSTALRIMILKSRKPPGPLDPWTWTSKVRLRLRLIGAEVNNYPPQPTWQDDTQITTYQQTWPGVVVCLHPHPHPHPSARWQCSARLTNPHRPRRSVHVAKPDRAESTYRKIGGIDQTSTHKRPVLSPPASVLPASRPPQYSGPASHSDFPGFVYGTNTRSGRYLRRARPFLRRPAAQRDGRL